MKATPKTKVSNHLNDDQFMECAIGVEPGVEAAAHLRECEACREELARFGMSVSSFNSAARAWSESLPAMSVELQGYRASRPFFAVASYALAACLMLGLGFEVVHHEQATRSATVGSVSVSSVSQEDSAAQIAQDNQLLMAVDVAIRSDDRSPVQEYGLVPETDDRARTRGTTREQ
jgi:predicted anti-sigma-YlaC factor YlaD